MRCISTYEIYAHKVRGTRRMPMRHVSETHAHEEHTPMRHTPMISWGKAPHDATPQAKCKHQQLRQKLANSYANYTNIIADL